MKKYSKITSSEAIRGMKLKLYRIVMITLASTKIMFLLPLLMSFRCYDSLKFPLTYNGKNESRPLLLSHCRYYDNKFTEMLLE